MSTTLNAEELAAKMFPARGEEIEYGPSWREAAKRTIREVAQPLADERDEYREALERISAAKSNNPEDRYGDGGTLQRAIDIARNVTSKYPKP